MKKTYALICLLLASAVSAETPSVEELQTQLKANPDDPIILYNLGMTHYREGDPESVLIPWSRLHELAPRDWRVRAKLIQAYSACGDEKNEQRDRGIAALYELRDSGEVPELSESAFYVRDQFVVGDRRVYVFEYFDLDAGWSLGPLLWKFYITEGGEPTGHFLSVGTYDATTENARARGLIADDERYYHLDEYWQNGRHATHGFFDEKPDYDPVKAHVLKILDAGGTPISTYDPEEQAITVTKD